MEWVLIVFFVTPGGDYAGKMPMYLPNQKVCEATLKKMKKPVDLDNPWGLKYQGGVCVTAKHWEGKEVMPGVALD